MAKDKFSTDSFPSPDEEDQPSDTARGPDSENDVGEEGQGRAEFDETITLPANTSAANAKLDQTIADAGDVTLESIQTRPAAELGHNEETLPSDALASPADSDDHQTVNVASESTHDLRSPLEDIDVTRTINPRELSAEDASAWNRLAAGTPGTSPPAEGIPGSHSTSASLQGSASQSSFIEGSITETKLQIRGRHVAAPQSDPSTPSDYRLVRMLGKGGMGNVYVARQGSLDRLIAVKVIKPLEGPKRQKLEQTGRLEAVERDRRQQFLSEAVVTGDLDHPNIVPIHDIAVTSDNTLFYAMKRVVGTPWSKVIKEKSRDENLDILLKVCDAIGFAHTRGVVHRDIKPENIMLGDFGVVMVMDWGLALAQPEFEKIDSITHAAGLGGTPAFMSPEMATGPLEKIGPAADIYLLGATLFYIITGTAPHHGSNVTECLKAVASNTIREVDPCHQGELLNIALQAMATNPRDRYRDVQTFQQAIRQYRAHAESVLLAKQASDDLQCAQGNRNYADFSRARFGFEQALSLWDGNEPARQGLAETTIAHATASLANEDFDLGLSLLEGNEPAHQTLIEQLQAGRRQRQQRASRLKLFKRIAAAMLVFILVGGSVAVYQIDAKRKFAERETERANRLNVIATEQKLLAESERETAERQRNEALRQEKIAKEQELLANQAKEQTLLALGQLQTANANTEAALRETERSEKIAKQAEGRALAAAEIAQAETKRAEYEAYLSQIGLAKARIETNEFDDARRILNDVRRLQQNQQRGLAWEWRWLWRQVNQSSASQPSPAALTQLALIRPAKEQASSRGIALLADGKLQPFHLTAQGNLVHDPVVELEHGWEATAIAISDDHDQVAIGTTRGDIQIWDRGVRQPQQTLAGHHSRVTCLQFLPGHRLASGATDKTARLWDLGTGSELETCWHIAAVRDLAISQVADDFRLVTAVADNTSGRAVVWSLAGETMKATRQGEFVQHEFPVTAIALSRDGTLAATGDAAGHVLVWQPHRIAVTNYAESMVAAVKRLGAVERDLDSPVRAVQVHWPLVDAQHFDGTAGNASNDSIDRVSTTSIPPMNAHRDLIESLCFSEDGMALLSASDDYTLKVWDVASRTLQKTLRGHGGWVMDASFVGSSRERVISASNDTTLRSWNTRTYVDAFTLANSPRVGDRTAEPVVTVRTGPRDQATIQTAKAHADEIWSARFDAGGTRIVSASRDHSARVLEVDPATMTFTEIATMQDQGDDRLREGTAFMAMSVAIDRDHGRLFIGSADATIRIWDFERGNELGQATGTGLNHSFALSRDGRLMLTGSSSPNHKALLWNLDPVGGENPKIRWRVQGHDQTVTAHAISPNSKWFFTGDRHGLGYLWSTETGERVGPSIEHVRGYRINSACFTPDNQQLLIAADDQQVTLIDLASRERLGRLPHEGSVTKLSLSLDGTRAVTVSELTSTKNTRTVATLWDLATQSSRSLYQLPTGLQPEQTKHAQRIVDARFGDQDHWIVVTVASDDGTPGRAIRWDVRSLLEENSRPVTVQLPQQLATLQTAMPLGDQRLVTLNGDAAFLWDLESMNHLMSYRNHGAVTHAAFSHDGRFVATASRSIKVWDARRGRSLGKIESPHLGLVRSVDFSPSSLELATGGDDGTVKRWIWQPDQQRFSLIGEFDSGQGDAAEREAIHCVRYSPDAKFMLAVGTAGTARLWSLVDKPGSFTRYDIPGGGTFTSAAFSPDGRWIVLGHEDKVVRLWPVVEAGETLPEPIRLIGHADRIEGVAIVQDASQEMRVLTASRDKSARVWDPRLGHADRLGREVVSLRRHTQGVTAVEATAGGELVMTAGRDGAVVLWPAGGAEPPSKLNLD